MLPRITALLFVLFAAVAPLATPQAQAAPGRPVLAYYFPWWENSDWQSGKMSDLPATLYTGGDDGAIARHIQQADDNGVDGFICTWYGPNEPRLTERCDKLL